MDVVTDTYDVGVITGRFQVPRLHDAHSDLIETVVKRHERVILMLGCSPANLSRENPLDYEARIQMISEEFPGMITFLPVYDKASDEEWSKELDEALAGILHPGQSVVIYGSRDSFIEHYHGKYPTQLLEAYSASTSGTNVRWDVAKSRTRGTDDFRAGVIHATLNRYDLCIPTVDIGIFGPDSFKRILLGKKPGEELWRLPGGFAEPNSSSYEDDAVREVKEETNLDISEPFYIDSCQIDDWRYQGKDKIKTMLFAARVLHPSRNEGQAGDDLETIKWFDFKDLDHDLLMPNHKMLIEILQKAHDDGRLVQ